MIEPEAKASEVVDSLTLTSCDITTCALYVSRHVCSLFFELYDA